MSSRRERSATRGDAVRITTAASDPREDMRRRQKRYLMSMSLRSICFVGAVLVDHPVRWVLIAGAVFLPYVAVVLANATFGRQDDFKLGPVSGMHPELAASGNVHEVDGTRP